MKQINTVYQHSGKINLTGLILPVLVGVIGALVLGAIYGYAIFYIPFIYLNFFIVLGYGLSLGYIIGKASEWGLLRNLKLVYLLGFLLGVFAEYTGWVAWIYASTEQQILLLNPFEIWALLKFAALKGVWSIFGWTPTGFFLYLFWAIEAVMIVGACTMMAGSNLSSTAYCEDCKKWLKDKTTIKPLTPLTEPDNTLSEIQQGSFGSLFALKKIGVLLPFYTRLELTECPGCRQLHLLTVDSVEVTKDKDSNDEENVTSLIGNFIIDTSTYHKLMALENQPENTDSPPPSES